MLSIIRAIFLSVILTLIPTYLLALEVTIVDQDGTPLDNAYVAIPSGMIEEPEMQPAVMDQVDVQFFPHVLAIDQGQSVIFPNSDNIRHHVYSFSEPKRFEIKLYQGVPNSPIEFDKPGLVALGCNIHDSMLAYIYVSPWPNYVVTDASGKARFEQDSQTIAVWHPWQKGQTIHQEIDISELTKNGQVQIVLDVNRPKPIKTYKKKRRFYDD